MLAGMNKNLPDSRDVGHCPINRCHLHEIGPRPDDMQKNHDFLSDAFVKKTKNAILQISSTMISMRYNTDESKFRFFTNESHLRNYVK